MEMATISKWCLVHLWGAKYLPFDACVMMALLFVDPFTQSTWCGYEARFCLCSMYLSLSLWHIHYHSFICLLLYWSVLPCQITWLFLWYFPFLPFCHSWKQEFSDPRDADDARYGLNGRDFDGSRIIVEFARGVCPLGLYLFASILKLFQVDHAICYVLLFDFQIAVICWI